MEKRIMQILSDQEALDRESAATDEEVKKYGIFDIKGSGFELRRNRCTKVHPCPRRVGLYAKLGLHRYNLLQGTKFQLKRVKKYIETLGSAARSYYMTLDAIEATAAAAAGGSSSLQSFQIQISEQICGKFILTCDIARIRGQSKSDKETILVDTRMPQWPLENPFERYCLLKEEVQSNDWIRLYVELSLATTEDRHGDSEFKLKIVNVATDVDEGLGAKNATFYIKYSDLSKGEDSDHIAIVRRRFDEDTGCFVLAGQSHQSSQLIPNKRKNVGEDSVDKRIKTGLPDHISSDRATREDHEAAVNSDSSGVSME